MRPVLIISSFLLLSFIPSKRNLPPVALNGIVVNTITGLPVSNVYVYAVKGEEEVITNSKGEFNFFSWEPLPVSLTVLHKDYEVLKFRVADASKTAFIKIKHK